MSARKSNAKLQPGNAIAEYIAYLSRPACSVAIPQRESETVSTQENLSEQDTDFAELQDGSLVEMIEDPANSAKSLLAVYQAGTVQYVERWPDHNRMLVPLSRANLLLKHVLFPRGAEPYDNLRGLELDVCYFFASCLDVDELAHYLMTAFVLASWFPERLPSAPYLALVGPPGSGKTTALRILSLLCRRSLLTADISSAAFYDLCHRAHPTLLIDETGTAGQSRTLLHLLRSSSSRGFVALRKDKGQLAFGPKAFSWIELPNDAALNSRCIIIPMHKTSRTNLNSPDDPKVLEFAEKVRMRLLQFRLQRYRSLTIPKVPAEGQLSSRALDLYRALVLPSVDDPEFCEGVAHFIADQRLLQDSLLSPAQAAAIRVLYKLMHEYPRSGSFSVGGLTRHLNADLASRGESALADRKTGHILTSLGLTNRGRKNPGRYVLWLNRDDRRRIHKMARDYEVEDVPAIPIESCEICTERERLIAAEMPGPKPVHQKRDRSHGPKHERRERHERRSGRRTRSTSGPLLR